MGETNIEYLKRMIEEGYEMKDDGFTFNGIDIADLGLEYVPDTGSTYVFAPGVYDISEEAFAAHDGGYYYGATIKPKDFNLRCIFENAHLNSGKLTRIMNVFKRGATGRLVFHNRPWCWYVATVVKAPQLQITNYMNGIITLSLRAYYPFARSDQTGIGNDDPNEQDLINNSAMIKGAEWDTSKDFGAMSNQTTIYVYNPGTETSATSITIEGNVGSGITIFNATTNQTCEVVGLSADDGQLTIDSLSGKILLTKNNNTTYGFLYHDNGFIDIASNYPILRDLVIDGVNGSKTFTISDEDKTVSQSMVGQRIGLYSERTTGFLGFGVLGEMILNNATSGSQFWIQEIVSVSEDGKTFTTKDNLDIDGYKTNEPFHFRATITSFNEIVITPKDTMDLTHFIVNYKPTFN